MLPKRSMKKGFIIILIGVYYFQDCIHLLASIRKFHNEPIMILTAHIPKIYYWFLKVFGNIIIKSAPSNDKHFFSAAWQAKISLYNETPFEKTIFIDCDICLLSKIDEVFKYLDEVDFLVVPDVRAKIFDAINLSRVRRNPLLTLQSAGLPFTEKSVQYNSGFIAFRKSKKNEQLFVNWEKYYDIVCKNLDTLLFADQGALSAAIEITKPKMKVLPSIYNWLDMWKNKYSLKDYTTVKVMHCTYRYRPLYAANVTRSLYTRIFNKLFKYILPQKDDNPYSVNDKI